MTDRTAGKDEGWMDRCRELARQASRAGNTAVGSVIVIGEEVIAEAEEATPGGKDKFAHAELVVVERALAKLGRGKLSEATLFTNVEPCFMCSYAIREAGIGRIVIGWPTPEIGGAESRYPLLAADDIPRWGQSPEIVWMRDEKNSPSNLKSP